MSANVTEIDFRVSPKTVQRLAVEKLRAAIVAGIFKPGDRLVETDLCALLGVSRPSVREALRSLEAEKLVAVTPNRGFFVPTLSWAEAEEIYKVRALLEAEAAALFTPRATPAQLRQMRSALSEFRSSIRSDDRILQVTSTSRFYDPILSGCGNRIIQEVLERLMARITFLRARSMSQAGRSKFSLREMMSIYDAIKSRDVERARAAAQDHVEKACAAAKRVYSEKE